MLVALPATSSLSRYPCAASERLPGRSGPCLARLRATIRSWLPRHSPNSSATSHQSTWQTCKCFLGARIARGARQRGRWAAQPDCWLLPRPSQQSLGRLSDGTTQSQRPAGSRLAGVRGCPAKLSERGGPRRCRSAASHRCWAQACQAVLWDQTVRSSFRGVGMKPPAPRV